jgi:hypothetical protein
MITGSPDPTLPLIIGEVENNNNEQGVKTKRNSTCRYKISHIFVETNAPTFSCILAPTQNNSHALGAEKRIMMSKNIKPYFVDIES